MSESREFNKNITLLREAQKGDKTQGPGEFFVLMIMDEEGRKSRPESDYWNFSEGEIGLEMTGDEKIYISKKFYNRYNLLRGVTWLVQVKNVRKCCNLTY